MSPEDFRRIALAQDGAAEGVHMGHADFRLAKGVFATLGYPDADFGMVKLRPEQQDMLTAAKPEIFSPVKGAWGAQGSTLVRLDKADEATLANAMAMAADNVRTKTTKR